MNIALLNTRLLIFTVTSCMVLSGFAVGLDRETIKQKISTTKLWLETQQQASGAWLPAEQPAITAIVLGAIEDSRSKRKEDELCGKGYAFLLNNLHPDGGIYGGTNYQNYNTSWSLIAFAKSGRSEFRPIIQKARPLIVSWQMDLGEKGRVDSPFDGGIGYGDGTPRANLPNTLVPLEALYLTRSLAKKGEPQLNQEMLREFLHRCQHLPAVNHETWVLQDQENGDGFIYNPGRSMAGEIKLPDGKVSYRAYGSMTYAGLLASYYAGVKKDDPAVTSGFKWIGRHFTVDENPGLGQDGLFHYYHLMAETFSIYKVKKIKLASGKEVDWREVLGAKLLSLQRPDGSWINPNDRWMEGNPVLCTAYALSALNAIAKGH
ncbi:MAG: cycloartenol synthase-like protein [Verrucomicrobiales bacterium]|nr:cycloartenol synthase-like protein [Verrucomicrobiales bacterium]